MAAKKPTTKAKAKAKAPAPALAVALADVLGGDNGVRGVKLGMPEAAVRKLLGADVPAMASAMPGGKTLYFEPGPKVKDGGKSHTGGLGQKMYVHVDDAAGVREVSWFLSLPEKADIDAVWKAVRALLKERFGAPEGSASFPEWRVTGEAPARLWACKWKERDNFDADCIGPHTVKIVLDANG